MKEIATTITQRGQVTIPVEVQRLLGVGPRDRVAFAIENDEVRLVPAKHTLESVGASLEPPGGRQDFDQMVREAKEEHAAEVVAKLHER
jgi:AbrB family looped-hinge helix DNA binding protein